MCVGVRGLQAEWLKHIATHNCVCVAHSVCCVVSKRGCVTIFCVRAQMESAKRGRGFKGALKENFLPLLPQLRQLAAQPNLP